MRTASLRYARARVRHTRACRRPSFPVSPKSARTAARSSASLNLTRETSRKPLSLWFSLSLLAGCAGSSCASPSLATRRCVRGLHSPRFVTPPPACGACACAVGGVTLRRSFCPRCAPPPRLRPQRPATIRAPASAPTRRNGNGHGPGALARARARASRAPLRRIPQVIEEVWPFNETERSGGSFRRWTRARSPVTLRPKCDIVFLLRRRSDELPRNAPSEGMRRMPRLNGRSTPQGAHLRRRVPPTSKSSTPCEERRTLQSETGTQTEGRPPHKALCRTLNVRRLTRSAVYATPGDFKRLDERATPLVLPF